MFDLAWEKDGLTELERESQVFLQVIQREWPKAYDFLLGQRWLSDEITEDARFLLCWVADAGSSEYAYGSAQGQPEDHTNRTVECPKPRLPVGPVTGAEILYFPWQTEGLNWPEHQALHYLQNIERNHPDVAQAVRANFHWLADGVIDREVRALEQLWTLAQQNASFAQRIASLEGDDDGLTEEALQAIRTINSAHPDVAETILGFPWVADGDITTQESWVIVDIVRAYGAHPDVAETVLGFPWVADDLTPVETGAIQAIVRYLCGPITPDQTCGHVPFNGDPDFADAFLRSKVLQSPLVEAPIHLSKYTALRNIHSIIRFGRWEQIVSAPWYRDGLTFSDYFLFLLLNRVAGDEDLFKSYVEGAQVMRTSLTLPLAGEVHFHVVSGQPFDERQVDENLRDVVTTYEDLLQVPWPRIHTYVLFGVRALRSTGGPGFVHHVRFDCGFVCFHELAHSYFYSRPMPSWFIEGAAEFLKYYYMTLHPEDYYYHIPGGDLQSAYDGVSGGCRDGGPSNVHEYLLTDPEPGAIHGCKYILGTAFVLGMYLSLGHETVISWLHEIAKTAQDLPLNASQMSELEVYQLLLENTPPEQKDQFRDLYRRLHGGPMPED